jgi:hypothetical protein
VFIKINIQGTLLTSGGKYMFTELKRVISASDTTWNTKLVNNVLFLTLTFMTMY